MVDHLRVFDPLRGNELGKEPFHCLQFLRGHLLQAVSIDADLVLEDFFDHANLRGRAPPAIEDLLARLDAVRIVGLFIPQDFDQHLAHLLGVLAELLIHGPPLIGGAAHLMTTLADAGDARSGLCN